MPAETYQREKDGVRLDLAAGMNLMLPADAMQQGFPYLANVRRNLQGRAVSRPALGPNILPGGIYYATSLVRLNDPYLASDPTQPAPNDWVLIIGSYNGNLGIFNPIANTFYVRVTALTGNPKSFVIFRPNASPQPWCYVADGTVPIPVGPGWQGVNILNPSYAAYTGPVSGMVKIRSDGTVFKTGIMEPQVAPSLSGSIVAPGNPAAGPNWVTYRYVYRSAITGAQSNPSPECNPGVMLQASLPSSLIYVADSGLSAAPGNIVPFNGSQWQFDVGSQTFRTIANAGTLMDYVICKNFGLSVPMGVNIDGVVVKLGWGGQVAGTGVMANIALYYQSKIMGNAKSPGISNVLAPGGTYGLGNTDTLGDNSDTWGGPLTPTVVNDPSFGFGVQIETAFQSGGGGTSRSFLYSFQIIVYYTQPNTGVTATPSTDPQVTAIDFYRMDPGLSNFTYVGTVSNPYPPATVSAPLTDNLDDLTVSNNPILQYDNFEPFPSIDLPRAGVVNIVPDTTISPTGMKVVQTGGDQFNKRWLPGTIILINGIAYTLYNRPSSTTQLIAVNTTVDPVTGYIVFAFPPAGSAQFYQIAEPTLAGQPSPVMWGPTPDNAGAFTFGLDPLNPGDLVWTKGNDFDAAPDTNRMFVTSPNEMLMNGTVTSELSTVFSTDRYWLINPNFADALSLTTGVAGQQWTLTQSQGTRGLYMRYAIAALGSLIVWRAKDCIAMAAGAGPEQSITDSIYNLFPHGGTMPQPVTIGGYTVYPPDDTNPNAQTITLTPTYIFYDYQDVNGTPRTLVFDIEAKGWSVDVYSPLVRCRNWAVGSPSTLYCGCTDAFSNGVVCILGGTPAAPPIEAGTSVIATRSEDGGEGRAIKRIGDVFFRALITAGNPVNVALWQTQFMKAVTAPYSPTSLTMTGATPALTPYIVDFSGYGFDTDDIGALLTWPLGSGNILDLWQPDWYALPENIQDRPADWSDCGVTGNKLIRGMIIEMDTFNQPKAIQVERHDGGALIVPDQATVTAAGHTFVPFTFSPPFVAHMLRIITTDGVQWRMWGSDAVKWFADPWPDYTPLYSAWMNLGQDGAKYIRGLIMPMDTNGQQAKLKIITSERVDGAPSEPGHGIPPPTIEFSALTPPAQKTQVAFAFQPPVVAHQVQVQAEAYASTPGIGPALWTDEAQWIFDPYPEITPQYTPVMEISGPDNKFFQGVKIVADSSNNFVGDADYSGGNNGQPVSFQVYYDGGKKGPLLGPTTFNGKQTTVYSFNPPFYAHDVQIVPLNPVRLFAGPPFDESKWDTQAAPESTNTWTTEASSYGLYGYIHMYLANLCYTSTSPVTMTVTTDGVPKTFQLHFPAAGTPTMPAKILVKCPPNKWKVASFSVTADNPSAGGVQVYQDPSEVWLKSWGSTASYVKKCPFGQPTDASSGATI